MACQLRDAPAQGWLIRARRALQARRMLRCCAPAAAVVPVVPADPDAAACCHAYPEWHAPAAPGVPAALGARAAFRALAAKSVRRDPLPANHSLQFRSPAQPHAAAAHGRQGSAAASGQEPSQARAQTRAARDRRVRIRSPRVAGEAALADGFPARTPAAAAGSPAPERVPARVPGAPRQDAERQARPY